MFPTKVAAEIARKAQPTGPASSGAVRGKNGGGKSQHKKERQQSCEQNSNQNTEVT